MVLPVDYAAVRCKRVAVDLDRRPGLGPNRLPVTRTPSLRRPIFTAARPKSLNVTVRYGGAVAVGRVPCVLTAGERAADCVGERQCDSVTSSAPASSTTSAPATRLSRSRMASRLLGPWIVTPLSCDFEPDIIN